MVKKIQVKREDISTKLGNVHIEGPVDGKYIISMNFDGGLNSFRIPEKQQKALAEIADSPDGIVYIIRSGQTIVGYVSFHEPDPFTRWSKHPKTLELGAIEISPKYRNNKLGVKLLKFAFSNPIMEEKVVITTEYCWHWDLENTGLDIWSYQKMLAKVFGAVGMVKFDTDDPDIREHAANVLMVRFGKNLTTHDIEQFKKLQFIET